MIITKLQGGLANQIFQWAYGKSLSLKYNTPLYLDTDFYLHQNGVTKRNFSLDKFPNLKFNILDKSKNLNEIDRKDKVIRVSDDFNFKNINYDDNAHYYLDGYWQSEKYFSEFSDIIREELYPDNKNLHSLMNTPLITADNNISLHVRRTDYITSNGFHPLQSIDYYQKGIDIIGDYNYIFVFSDDIEWCRNNIKFNNTIYVDKNQDVFDLWLMSMCKNNIIANSSFSWWAAWLNNNPDKKVIAPSKWFGDHANLNSNSIIPNNWIKI